jgi:thioredoxin 2
VLLPWIAEAGDEDFGEVVDRSAIPVLVDFWATWCGPCRIVTPILEQLSRDVAGRVKLVKTNVDLAPRTARRFEVQEIPTLMVAHRGKVIARQPGAAPGPAVRQWVEEALRRIGEPTRHGSGP